MYHKLNFSLNKLPIGHIHLERLIYDATDNLHDLFHKHQLGRAENI